MLSGPVDMTPPLYIELLCFRLCYKKGFTVDAPQQA